MSNKNLESKIAQRHRKNIFTVKLVETQPFGVKNLKQ